jgi:HSP20 family protein
MPRAYFPRRTRSERSVVMGLIKRGEMKTWDPFRELEDMSSRLNRLFGFSPARTGNGGESFAMSEWTPTCDVSETEDEYVVKAELPGVDKKDAHVTLEQGVLTIRGERKQEKEEKGKKFHRVECSYGSFMRSFAMPEDADENKIEARYKDGVLEVHVAKSEAAKKKSGAREIQIKA